MVKFLQNFKKNKSLLVMSLPGLLWFFAFCYLPMFGIIIAFKDFKYSDGFLGSKWVGLKNFKFLFQTSDAFIITRNTLLYNIAFICLNIISAVSLAIIFDMLGKSKLNKLNQTVVLLPHFFSWIVVSYFVFSILSMDKGIANNIITAFGGKRINWYSEPKYWPYILFITNEWKRIGYASIIYYSNIRGFNQEYYEAARIDSATWFQLIWYITIPLLKPIVTIMFLINMGSIMHSDFGLFYIIPKNSGMLYSVTSTIDTYIYNGITGIGDMGSTAAAGFYQSVIGFLLVVATNAIVKKISSENALF